MRKNEFTLLSDREEQVLLLSTKGLTDKEIAKKLGLSIATVNTYWVRIRTKLGGANRSELVAAALHMNAEETLTAKERENQRLIGEVIRRAEAERALRESESRLQAVIDRTPEIVFIKDSQGYYTLVNREFEALVGKDRREILTKRDYDLFGVEQGELFRTQDQTVLETEKALECDITVETPNGPRSFLLVKFPLFNADGTAHAVCGFAREITGRIEFENKLRDSERRYRTLIENGNDVVALLDRSGRVTYVSQAIESVLGVPAENMVGKNAFQFVAREDIAAIKADFSRLLKEPGLKLRAQYRLKHANGEIRYVDGLGQNLLDDPAVGAVVLNYRDVTERKLGERRLAAQHVVAKTLAEVSDLEAALAKIAQSLCEILSFDYGGIWLLDEASGQLEYSAGWHSGRKELAEFVAVSLSKSFQSSEGFPLRILTGEKAQWDSDIQNEPYLREAGIRSAGFKTSIGFQIVGDDKALGGIELFSRQVVPVDDSFLSVLDIIGHQIGQFLQRKTAEGEELQMAKQLSTVHSQRDFAQHELKAANEALERRVRTRTIELEEANTRLQEEVAERRRAERDLFESFRFAQQVLESSVDGVIGFDGKLLATVWNRSMEELSGLGKEDALGQCVVDLLPFLGEEEEVLFRQVLSGEAVMVPKRPFLIAETGRKGYFEARYSPIRNEENQVVGGLGVIREVFGPAEE